MRWWGAPSFSDSSGWAVPMGIPAYTCMESADTTSPLWALAKAAAKAVFPEAVGPATTATGIFFSSCSIPLLLSSPFSGP